MERTLREKRRNRCLEPEDMERARNKNIHRPGVEEDVNTTNNWGQNEERETTLEEGWKPVIRDDYLNMAPIITNNFKLKPSLINLV